MPYNNKRNNQFKARFSSKRRNQTRPGSKSSLDPNTLIQKSVQVGPVSNAPTRSWNEMPIGPGLKENLSALEYHCPTQVQDNAIEPLVRGRDMVGIARTGTGKTAAFLIPLIEQLSRSAQGTKALVVVPTRELALQVDQEFRKLSRGMGFRSVVFIGGTNLNNDLKNLRRSSNLLVGTPGRLLDLYNRNALQLKQIPVLVIDEFDRMLDMGFVKDVERIARAMSERDQTMLFSATEDPNQKRLIAGLVSNPVEIKVSSGAPATDQVEQDIIRVTDGQDKFQILLNLISNSEFEKVLLFAETKRTVDRLSKRLSRSGVKADMIHGNKSQNYRNGALDKFRKGKVKVLVATDVAARGIDVFNVTHVINYQVPRNLESYTHRIGRTGRAGRTGKAFTFVD